MKRYIVVATARDVIGEWELSIDEEKRGLKTHDFHWVRNTGRNEEVWAAKGCQAVSHVWKLRQIEALIMQDVICEW